MRRIIFLLVTLIVLLLSNSCTSDRGATTIENNNTSNSQISEAGNSNTQVANEALPEVDQENKRILAKLNEEGCLYSFNKKLFPAEKIFDVEKLDLPIKIEGHYWSSYKMYDPQTYLIDLLERDPFGSTLGTVSKEFGLYNFVTKQYTKIVQLDNSKQFYVRGIQIIDNTKGEFLLIDSITETENNSVKLQYINLTGEMRTLYELPEQEYHFMLVPQTVGRKVYLNRIIENENKLISIDVDTGSVEEVENTAIMPQLFNGNLIYLKGDTNEPKIDLIGADFSLSWVRSDHTETPSNTHGSVVTHPTSKDVFVLTKINDTEKLKDNLPVLTGDQEPSNFPLYILKKHSAMNPAGEEIFSIRGGEYSTVYVGELEFDGRFLTWYTYNEDIFLVYDNQLDVILYFSNIDMTNVPETKKAPILLSPSGHAGILSVPRKPNDENSWDSTVNVEPYDIRFILKKSN